MSKVKIKAKARLDWVENGAEVVVQPGQEAEVDKERADNCVALGVAEVVTATKPNS